MKAEFLKDYLWIVLILCVIQLQGQDEVRFRKITKEEGLSNNSVFAITQDNQGFLWFGTRNGLNRYDGYRLKKYFHDDSETSSLISNNVRSLFYDDSTKSIWIGTENGLSNFFIYQDRFVNYFKNTNTNILGVTRSSRGHLLIATNTGLFVHLGDTTVSKVEIQIGKSPSISTIFEDKSGLIWISADDELLISQNKTNLSFLNVSDTYPELNILNGVRIKTILEDSDGQCWFGSEFNGLYIWDKKNKTIINYKNDPNNAGSLSSNRIRAVCEDINKSIWIGTSIGINIYQPESDNFKRIINEGSNPGGLSNNSIRSIHLDNKGGLWIGTYYQGVNYTDESFNRFNISYLYSGISNDDRNIVSAISTDKRGNILVGTEGKGIGIWNNMNFEFEFIDLGEKLKSPNVKVIYPHKESVWIGTYREGMIRLNSNYEVEDHFINGIDKSSSITSNNVYDILEYDQYLWLATFGGGLNRMDLNTNAFESFTFNPDDDHSIGSNNTRVLHEDLNGDLWIGTINGVSRMIPTAGEMHFKNLLKNVDVYCIESLKINELWVGTLYKGLFKIDLLNNAITNYSIKEGFIGNTVYAIVPDGDDLWLSTNNGIVKFNTQSEEFLSYGFDVELSRIEFSPNASHIYRDGLYMLGSNSGLVFFEPSKILVSDYIPPLVLSDIRILGDSENESLISTHPSINETNHIDLEYKNSNLEIEFSSLDYTGPVNNKYAYRMNGVDSDWIFTVGKPEAIYTIQKEGDYVFEFRGSNSDGIWNPTISSLSISVSPPWFRSWWAYVIYVMFFVGVLFLLYRLFKLRNTYHIEHIAKMEQERTHEIKIRFFTNITHELRTPLTLMLGPLHDIIKSEDLGGTIRNKLEGVHKNVVRLSHLVNQLLDFRKLETDHMKLKVSDGEIIDFLKEIYFAFREETQKRNIEFLFESEKTSIKCWYDADKMEKVFFNLLSNALKFTPDFGSIKIWIGDDEKAVTIKVIDSGPGIEDAYRDQIFDRFYERNSINYSNNQGIGIGLALSKQLVELHQAEIFVDDQESIGSTFVVVLKKGSSHFKKDDFKAKDDGFIKSHSSTEHLVSSDPNEVSGKKLSLLIIEDDLEIRDYIKTLFVDEFNVSLASNGLEGFELACEKIPDIIISDVMMPEMDGITMCGKLKTTLETSHIPIILLTARSATQFRIGGLETGADDYITKPFSSDELLLKTKNILTSRNAYLEKLARTHDFEPKRLAITSTDEKFLKRLIELTEANIENSNITVEQLADDLYVSRALLFTKIKFLTGKTPKGFVKEFRLKRAAQLLEDTDLNVSQVAHKSGFHDYRYFTKVFKSLFKVSPKEYSKNHNRKDID